MEVKKMDTSYWVPDEPKKDSAQTDTEQQTMPVSRREIKHMLVEEVGPHNDIDKGEKKLPVKILDASYWVSGDTTTRTAQVETAMLKVSNHVKPSVTGGKKASPLTYIKTGLPKVAAPSTSSAVPNTASPAATETKPDGGSGKGLAKMVPDKEKLSSSKSDSGLYSEFEKFRLFYESDHEWNMRKAFIIAHHDKLPTNRLISLSNCFINTAVYGSSYPKTVMQELSVLKQDLGAIIGELEERVQAKRKAAEVKFVKASSNDGKKESDDKGRSSHHHPDSHHHPCHRKTGSQSNSSAHSSKQEQEKLGSVEAALLSGSSPQKRKRKISETDHDSKAKVMTFVKSDSVYQSTDNVNRPSFSMVGKPEESCGNKAAIKMFESAVGKHVQPPSEIDHKFVLLQNWITEAIEKNVKHNNSIDLLHYCTDKVKMSKMTLFAACSIGQACELQFDTVIVARGTGTSKKAAKRDAYDKALEKLKRPYLQIISINPEKKELEASDEPYGESPQVAVVTKGGLGEVAARGMKRLHIENAHILQNFIIIEPMKPKNKKDTVTAAAVIRTSSEFSKMKLAFEFRDESGELWCRVLLEHEVLADMPGLTTKEAKNEAAEKALENLRHHCYTIKTKKNEDVDDGLSREAVLGDIAKAEEKIDSGIGNKLLKMMGWTGGGIGKKGTGIEEPVKADAGIINRQGLGLTTEKGITPSFRKCIRDVVSEYAKSDRQDDMKFSATFSNEERAIIHKECHKFGLRTRSHGKTERYLMVSRKRTANQLVHHLMECGGSDDKYELCPPGSYHSDSDG